MANGGKREGAGRPAGVPNKITRTMKERAAKHGRKALLKLVELLESEDEAIRLRAANDLLDRGYGKPAQTQIHQGDEAGGPVQWQVVNFGPPPNTK